MTKEHKVLLSIHFISLTFKSESNRFFGNASAEGKQQQHFLAAAQQIAYNS
jgi:hypothetical protein